MQQTHDFVSLKVIAPAAMAVLLLAGAMPARAQDVRVVVNDRPVRFGDVQPVKIHGRVMIPLRGVVEALGAEVRWDPGEQTVRGRKGGHSFSLAIGSREGSVDGRPTPLDVPAMLLGGRTMVPLRFAAEALGAEVHWNAAERLVSITTGAPVAERPEREPEPEPRRARTTRVRGEVLAVRAEDRPPSLTIRTSDGDRVTFRISRDAEIVRGPRRERGRPINLEQIRRGDQVSVRTDAEGDTALSIEVLAAEAPREARPTARAVTGEVVSIRDEVNAPAITLRTRGGSFRYALMPDTQILVERRGDTPRRGHLDELQPGDRVRLELGPSGAVARVVVNPGLGEAPPPRDRPERDRPDRGDE